MLLINNNDYGKIIINEKSVLQIIDQILKKFNNQIIINHIKVRTVSDFYWHIELVLHLKNAHDHISSLTALIKKTLLNNIMKQLDINIYNIIIMFH